EQQFAHDEELKFKATARRNKLLGLWAAEKLGLAGAEADSYALSVVMADLEGGDAAGKIRKDFDAKGVAQSDHQIARTMTDLMAKAVADIRAGKKRTSWLSPHSLWRNGCMPAKRSIPAGVACPIRWWPRRWRATALSQSQSKASTACGTSAASWPASPRCARAARRRSCACRSTISRW